MKHWMAALVLALWALLGSAPALADADLDKLAQVILEATTAEDRSPVEKRYEPELSKAISAAYSNTEELVLDFDWMTNSQEADLGSIAATISSKVSETSPGEAVIQIRFDTLEREEVIDYHVRKAGKKWMIHDVEIPKSGFSLRQTLGLE